MRGYPGRDSEPGTFIRNNAATDIFNRTWTRAITGGRYGACFCSTTMPLKADH